MRINLEKLYRKAASRPPGYLEEVLAAGSVKDGYLEITWPAYQRLVAQYGAPVSNWLTPHDNPRQPMRGVGDLVAQLAQPIARTIDRVVGTNLQNCNKCKQRQARLNAAVPFQPGQKHPN